MTHGVSSAKITQTTNTLKWILGGQNILSSMSTVSTSIGLPSFVRIYTNLPPHNFLGFHAVFWYFDDLWGSSMTEIRFVIDGPAQVPLPELIHQTDFTTFDGGKSGELDLGRNHIKLGLPHNGTSLRLEMASAIMASPVDQSFGFREVHIHLSNYSGSNFVCQISEDVNPLYFAQCPCSLNQAKDSNGNCVNCAANCDLCFGPAAGECLACSAGTYWDGTQCNTCDISCLTCTGATNMECPSCKYGFYNYGNNTCLTTCEALFVVEQIGLEKYCKKKCTSPQFYWSFNQSCLDQCDFPLIHSPDENGIEHCLNPCPSTSKFLYANGSCLDTCKPPLVSKFNYGVKFCVNPCSDPANDYLFLNGSCLPSCPSPLLGRSEPGTQYCWSPCSSSSHYLYNNGSCETTCPTPLISRSESGVKYCYTPCGSVNDFIYDNRSCGTSCPSPLVSRTELLVAQYCLNPCLSNSNSFLYPNGSCLTSCNFPLLNRSEPGVKYCYASCSDFIYQNGTCENKCPFPLMSRSEPDFKYCFTLCKSDEYLYSDQSCHSSCDLPLVRRLESGGGVKYCDTRCDENEYVYPDGSCNSKCEYPYKILSNPSYKVCSMNLDEIQISQARSLAHGTDIANTVCGIGGLLTGFITPGDPTSMLMWSLLKMLQFGKYIDVSFPGQMVIVFSQQNDNYNGDGYMSSLGRVLNAQNNDLGKFSYYNIPQGFLENYWQQLIVFASLLVMVVISTLLLRLIANPQHIKAIKHIKSALQWNVILMFFCGSYGDLILYSAIEFQTASFNSVGSVIGFFICLLMVILAFSIPFKSLYVIWTLRRETENKWLDNRVFFEAYKSGDALQHIFLFIYLVRVAFFNIIIGYIFKSPLAQAILINIMSVGTLTYLLVKSPLKDRFCFAQHVKMESMLLVYNMCLLILVIMDLAGAQAESTRAFFGGIMVVILIVGPVGTAVLIILKLILRLQALHSQLKANKEKAELVGKPFRFNKELTRGDFTIENNPLTQNPNAGIYSLKDFSH